jgi:hypothetical protein
MSIKQLRTGIRAWLEREIRIDAWDLDAPANLPMVVDGVRYPANSAIEVPVQDLSFYQASGTVYGRGKFIYLFIYRFAGAAAKEQLPVSEVESLINYLCEQAVLYPQELWERIKLLEIQPIEQPVILARVEGEDSDWLLVGRLEMEIEFRSDAADDFGDLQPATPPDKDIVLKQLAIAVNRSYSPVTTDVPASYTQDAVITLLPNP